jgi:hypothetical protein
MLLASLPAVAYVSSRHLNCHLKVEAMLLLHTQGLG